MNHLIVARWQEDVSWVERAEGWEPLIVQKDVDLPNTGREASSYFYGLHKLYPVLKSDDRVACVQGDPTPHCDIIAELRSLAPRGLGAWHESDADGCPDHCGLQVSRYYQEWIGPFPGRVKFVAGANLIVSGESVLSRERSEYEQMMTSVVRAPDGPWVMERMWIAYFGLDAP